MAVYTEVGTEELEGFIALYEIGGVISCKGIAEGVENSNFIVSTEGGHFILTLYEKRVKREDLPFFLGLLHHLADRGLPCPTPIVAKDGEALRLLAGRPACLFEFLEGVSVRRPTPLHCGELGEALARLHLAGRDYKGVRENALSIAGWHGLEAACRDRADSVQSGLSRLIGEELQFLSQVWPKGLPQGVIHADLFPDNVLFLREKLNGLIDFYFACNDMFAYDIAICLNAWCFEGDGAFNITKARIMLSRYGQVRPLAKREITSLPLLARGAALRFLLTRLYDWLNREPGAFVRPKDPLEYVLKLNFHQGVRSPEDYGIGL